MRITKAWLVLLLACAVGGAAEIDRKTFSMTLPDGWTEDTKNKQHNPDLFVIFENPESCAFMVVVGKKSAGHKLEEMLKPQKTEWGNAMSDVKTTNITTWSEFKGTGFELEGKMHGTVPTRVRIFGFEKGDLLCVIIEFGTLEDLKTFDDDYRKIQKSFKLK
jgi:hypothetical protein